MGPKMRGDSMQTQYQRVRWNLIDAAALRPFHKSALWPWLGTVAFEWTLIGFLMWMCHAYPSWWMWVAGVFLIGTRQHALAVLAHDGTHHAVSNSRFWNDTLANYLTAYPLTLTIEGYRAAHLKHHWYLETPDDPSRVTIDLHPKEWTFPMSKWYLIGLILRGLVGLNSASSITLMKYLWDIPGGIRPHLTRLLLFHGVIIAICAATGHLMAYLILWLLPLYTVTVTLYRLRSIAEHLGMGRQEDRYDRNAIDQLRMTRTTTMGLLSKFFFLPYNVSYHIEHHLYPAVPTFRLRALHNVLKKNSAYNENAHITHGHWQLFQELTGIS